MIDGLSDRVGPAGGAEMASRKGWTVVVENGSTMSLRHFRDEASAEEDFVLLTGKEAFRFADEAIDLIERAERDRHVRLPDGIRISLLNGSPTVIRAVLLKQQSMERAGT